MFPMKLFINLFKKKCFISSFLFVICCSRFILQSPLCRIFLKFANLVQRKENVAVENTYLIKHIDLKLERWKIEVLVLNLCELMKIINHPCSYMYFSNFFSKDPAFYDLWDHLKYNGILEGRLINHVWSKFKPEDRHQLLDIMEQFDLICAAPSAEGPMDSPPAGCAVQELGDLPQFISGGILCLHNSTLEM